LPAYDKSRKETASGQNQALQIIQYISQDIRSILRKIDPERLKCIEEIRLRANKPLMLQECLNDYFLDTNGNFTSVVSSGGNLAVVSREDIVKSLELMSQNSVYAYQDEINSGYMTLKGGHRVGVCGRVVMEGASIKNIKDISGLNIRIARQVHGCSAKIIRHILKNDRDIYNTLILSPPQCGKTTMLRDIALILSDGSAEPEFRGVKVGIVDERSEIAACHKGVPQFQVGVRTDIIDGCAKSLGMLMMIRSMSPHVIITDEIGNRGDMDAVINVLNAGVKIITSAHGYDISELRTRREVLEMLDAKVFDRYIVLSGRRGPGTIEEIVDGKTMRRISGGDGVAV
jgi:stage III sporulation protein AA